MAWHSGVGLRQSLLARNWEAVWRRAQQPCVLENGSSSGESGAPGCSGLGHWGLSVLVTLPCLSPWGLQLPQAQLGEQRGSQPLDTWDTQGRGPCARLLSRDGDSPSSAWVSEAPSPLRCPAVPEHRCSH